MLGETILVIDSDSDTTQQISATLESEDYLVFTAPSGDIGITMAKKVNPSVIFINPVMAGTSGLEVCKTIHSAAQLKNVPIVVLSAFEGATDPRYTSVYGIVDSLKKPFTPEELVSKTRSVLSMKPGEPVQAEENAFSHGNVDEAVSVEEDSRIRKGFGEEDFSDQTVVMSQDNTPGAIPKTPEPPAFSDKAFLTQKEPESRNEETVYAPVQDEAPETETAAVDERPYVMKKNIRRRSMRSPLLVPIIVVLVIVVLGAGGFFAYSKGLLPWFKPKTIVAAKKPAQPVEQPSPETPPPAQPDTKPSPQAATPVPPAKTEAKTTAPLSAKTETKVIPTVPIKQEPKPAPKASVPSTVPAPKAEKPASAPKAATAPTSKVTYSVQIGAFKSSANAEALAKQFKDKGYDSFVQKSPKDGDTIHRVLVGKFENTKDASKTAQNINSKENIKAIVHKE